MKHVYANRGGAVAIDMTSHQDRWYILYVGVFNGSILPRFFHIPAAGASRTVAREVVTFGAGEGEAEVIEFAKLQHIGRGFDLRYPVLPILQLHTRNGEVLFHSSS